MQPQQHGLNHVCSLSTDPIHAGSSQDTLGAAKHVIRYLKGMRDLELTYRAASTGIVRYTDADHTVQYH